MAEIYLDRDNRFKFKLMKNGSVVESNALIKVDLYVPGEAFSNGLPVTYSTGNPEMTFQNSNTEVVVDLADSGILEGRYRCYVTGFDSLSVDGFAWDSFTLNVKKWINDA